HPLIEEFPFSIGCYRLSVGFSNSPKRSKPYAKLQLCMIFYLPLKCVSDAFSTPP
ncbi:hypothetical protein RUM43_001194, partial [Polyplax serrata]